MMYSWTVSLPEETKISDAYQMLKKQGIIKQDPDLPDDKSCPPPPPRPKNAIFEDEEKSKVVEMQFRMMMFYVYFPMSLLRVL
ncbi:ADP-ribosylation factor-binding protein GGA1-like [Sinocyclocheilus grahami]|uniref:ADP-ribosylation factor-binding protein GGA1-like n=1 Tax=Sinocyclocheilus grahami TaxID=75366 RepID=UPI0007AC7F5B|nr:PREDICTED: ADP-ribosylation factor-binding protein GGA1-like [Sinocyclocheilus grahami]